MDSEELRGVLQDLDRRLSSRTDLVVVGGAAMILHFGALRATRDMGDRIESLFHEWHQLGGAVLLAERMVDIPVRLAEGVIAESTAYARHSGRLTWVVLDWLLHHVDELDQETLLKRTAEFGDLSVLGVLCDAALQRREHPAFRRLIACCPPHNRPEPFFHRVARSPFATKLTRERPLEIFSRWNYLCNELRYLEDEVERSA